MEICPSYPELINFISDFKISQFFSVKCWIKPLSIWQVIKKVLIAEWLACNDLINEACGSIPHALLFYKRQIFKIRYEIDKLQMTFWRRIWWDPDREMITFQISYLIPYQIHIKFLPFRYGIRVKFLEVSYSLAISYLILYLILIWNTPWE